MRSRYLGLALSVLVLSLSGLAQSPTTTPSATPLGAYSSLLSTSDAPDVSTRTFSAKVREVNVLFSASDWRGRFVSNLTAADVKVFDNGQPAESITYFLREENLPLKIAMLIDISGSVTNVFRGQQKAAVLFLQQTLRPSDKAALITFADEAHVIQDFTSSMPSLTSGISGLSAGDSSTAIYDAVQVSCEKLARDRNSSLSRHALILITDGDDNHSESNIDAAIDAALKSEVVIFALNTHPIPQYTDPMLKKLAESTGGGLLHAAGTAGLASAFRRVNQQLRSQYLLGYKPPRWDTDRSFHRIHLTTHRFGLHVHCRKGYYQAD